MAALVRAPSEAAAAFGSSPRWASTCWHRSRSRPCKAMLKLLAPLLRRLRAPRVRLGARARRLLARRRRRGVALLLVLSSLTILTVMLTEIQDENAAELSSALTARDAVVAEYAARSAVNLSRLLIASEPTIRKTLAPILALMMGGGAPQIPVWDYTDRVMGAFNDAD